MVALDAARPAAVEFFVSFVVQSLAPQGTRGSVKSENKASLTPEFWPGYNPKAICFLSRFWRIKIAMIESGRTAFGLLVAHADCRSV